MYKNKNILCVVPARGGSKGIPLKNLKKIQNIPMIGLVGNIVVKLGIFDRAIVSTDHRLIADTAMKYGLEAPFLRPKNLSGDIIGDVDVLLHALHEIEKKDKKKYDIIVMLQPTSPLRKCQHVKDCLDKLIDENLDSVWTISKTDSKSHPLKQLVLNKSVLELYDIKGNKIVARQQLKNVYHRNGAAYVISRDCLTKQNTLLPKKTGAIVIEDLMISVDNQFDLNLIEFVISKYDIKLGL